ncbi:MAG: hypothetical protein QGG24_03045 [Vicinamibacterales bacterium]|nr:hypothetical protein [Vicinamibacterales bacterium]
MTAWFGPHRTAPHLGQHPGSRDSFVHWRMSIGQPRQPARRALGQMLLTEASHRRNERLGVARQFERESVGPSFVVARQQIAQRRHHQYACPTGEQHEREPRRVVGARQTDRRAQHQQRMRRGEATHQNRRDVRGESLPDVTVQVMSQFVRNDDLDLVI